MKFEVNFNKNVFIIIVSFLIIKKYMLKNDLESLTL